MRSGHMGGDRVRHFRGGKQVRISVKDRWMEIFRTGEAMLHDFTAAELAVVSLQREAMPPEPGPVLAAVTALPADPQAAASAAATLARLERQGYVRPWPPAEPDGPRPIPLEYPGWALSPEGGRRPVALAGDLAVIVSTRGMPAWVAEVSAAAQPARPDPDSASWNLIARVYARYRPPSGLVEFPPGPDGTAPSRTLLRDDRILLAFVAWCGAGQAAAARHEAGAEAGTDDIAAGFTRLVQVRFALPHGDQVRVRTVIVASGGGGQWMLEGKYWERAVSVSADDLGERFSAIVKSAIT